MGVKMGVRQRYDRTISEILNFTVELSRTRCLNFSDILRAKSSAEYVLEFHGDSKNITVLIWPAAPPAPAGLGLVFCLFSRMIWVTEGNLLFSAECSHRVYRF